MRTLLKALMVVAITAVPAAALAQEYSYADVPQDTPVPSAPAPDQLPPPPPTAAAPEVQVQVQPVPVPVLPAGQWPYTSQYGWVWLPYAQAYTYVPADGGYPSVYAYYPAYGWRWIVAPWVFNFGPRPYWGVHGPARFAWHARPWFRVSHGHGGYRHRYEAARVYGHHESHGYRGGYGERRSPAARPEYRPSRGGNHWAGGHPAPSRGNHGNRGHPGNRGNGHYQGSRNGGGHNAGHAARPAGRR
ncbi:MAG: hypothetical protein HY901_35805 [Deltaproteobacteria bacterium]|nr:hypothetical protein [Deltaproteobacteria bacterium]